jgi:hypothetical protein
MFDEEGVELRGGLLDVDFDHVQLDVLFLPSLDPSDAVVWDVQLAVRLDGGVLSDLMRGERGQIERVQAGEDIGGGRDRGRVGAEIGQGRFSSYRDGSFP